MPAPAHVELTCSFLHPVHTLRVTLGQGCMGLKLLGNSSAPLLAHRQERENKQVQEVGKNELVEARGGKQWQVNTAEQEEKDVYVCLFKVCSGDKCKSVRTVSILTVL